MLLQIIKDISHMMTVILWILLNLANSNFFYGDTFHLEKTTISD